MTNRKKKNFKIDNLSSLFLSLLICLNGIRCMLGIADSSMLLNLIYVIFLLSIIKRFTYLEAFKFVANVGAYILVLLGVIFYALFTAILNNQISCFFKLLMITFVSLGIMKMTTKELSIALDWTCVICTIYVLYVVTNIETVGRYIASGSNYLNVTLPIGLGLCLMLDRTVYSIINKGRKLSIIVYGSLSVLFFYSLTLFPARGSILIPVIVFLFVSIIMGRKDFKTFLYIVVIGVVLLYVGYQLFKKYAGAYLLQRMHNLFTNVDSEDRWGIWTGYIKCIVQKKWWLVGCGTNGSIVYYGAYPHNLILQLIGEFGILGIVVVIYGSYLETKSLVLIHKLVICQKEYDSLLNRTFYQILSGFLYTFLTFMKSFSLYDSSIFMIFFSIAIAIWLSTSRDMSLQECNGIFVEDI